MINSLKYTLIVFSLLVPTHLFAENGALSTTRTASEVNPLTISNILQMAAGLAFVLLLIFLLGWLYRRFGSPKTINNGDFRVVAGLSMGQRERIVMLEVGDKQILLGVGPGHVEKIHVFDEPVIKTHDTGAGESFSERLSSVIKQRVQQ